MLNKISIKGFKAISDEVELPLRPFNVIIGRNGSGKSSALEALNWLGTCLSEGAKKATKPFHRIDDLINSSTSLFELSLEFDPRDLSIGDFINYRISVVKKNDEPSITKEELIYPAQGETGHRIITTDQGREYQLALKGGISRRDRDLLRKRAKGDKSDKPLESILYALDALERQEFSVARNQDEALLKLVDSTADRGGHLLREYLERAVFLRLSPNAIGRFSDDELGPSRRLLDEEGTLLASLLEQLDEESIQILMEKIRFVTGRVKDCNVHSPVSPADRRYFEFTEATGDGRAYQVPAWVMSEGTRRITAILALLLHDNPPPLLCIEEIENGLDPWTIKFILEELSSASIDSTQIILTTHSPHLLNYVPLENVILVENDTGKVIFTPAEELSSDDAIFDHMGVGDLYVNRYLHEKAEGSDS